MVCLFLYLETEFVLCFDSTATMVTLSIIYLKYFIKYTYYLLLSYDIPEQDRSVQSWLIRNETKHNETLRSPVIGWTRTSFECSTRPAGVSGEPP